MTPKQFSKARSKEEVAELCKAAGCSLITFKNICSTQQPSYKLARRIEKASKQQITVMEVLEPERFGA